MKKVVLLFILGIHSLLIANNEWTFVNGLDDFTDEKVQYVSYEDRNHKFQIRNIDGMLWFYITRKKWGSIYKETSVHLRVDRKELFKANVGTFVSIYNESNTPIEERNAFIDRKNIFFDRINALILDDSFFCDMYKGNFLKIKYETDTMESEVFKIPLNAFKKVFTKALDKDLLPKCE